MFGRILFENRTREKLSQEQLAISLSHKYQVPISKSMICRWENGTQPLLKHAIVVIDFFNVNPNLLFKVQLTKR